MFIPTLVLALLAFLAGLLPALRFIPPPAVCLSVAAVTLLLAYRCDLGGPLRRKRRTTGLLLLTFAAAGAALGAARAERFDCRTALPDRAPVEVRGFLGAGIFPEEDGDSPPLLPLEGTRVSVRGNECFAPIRGILPPGAVEAPAGSQVHLRGIWIRSKHFAPDGAWPADGYRSGYLRADTLLEVEPPSLLQAPFLTLRGRSERHLADLFPGHFPLVEALILNRRERVDRAVIDRFSRAGLTHLLAISGGHVAVLAAILLVVGGVLRLPRSRITWSTIILVNVYLVLIGAPASAVRAGAMVSLLLLASLLQRPAALLPIAAAAAFFIIALNPLAVLDVGLQLSFAGVFGIIAVQRTVGRRMARVTRGRPWHALVETLVVSTAAFIATAPITAYHFGTIAPIAIVANVPAIPLTGLALVGVLAAAVAAPIRPVADLLAAGTGLSLDLLDRVATFAANVPFGNVPISRPDLVTWLAAATVAALIVALQRGRWMIRGGVAAGIGVTVLIVWPMVGRTPSRGLELHFLDVGQGDAAAIRTPHGRWLLVDAGPRGADYDAGERRVVPFLRAHGVTRIAAMILTHPHADHIGGAPAVMRHLRVDRVIEPGMPVGTALYLELLQSVEDEGAQWVAARSERAIRIDGVELRLLWPDEGVVEQASDANDVSAIVLLRYGSFSALLTGDASSEIEERLVKRYGPELQARILKVGHHGSSSSTSTAFLRALSPELAVISVGRENRYGHPAPDAIERIRASGVDIARTDREGTVSIRVLGDGTLPWERIGQ